MNNAARIKRLGLKKEVRDPDKELIRGIAIALADVHRIGGNSDAVRQAASNAGLTIAEFKKVGVDPHDWKELKKAGVP